MADTPNYVPVKAHLRRTSSTPSGDDIQQEHQPDVQAFAEGDDGSDMLPMGSSSEGMSGGVNPDDASLVTGHSIVPNDVVNAPPPMPRDGYFDPIPHEEREGFAGRPQGWDR